MAKKSSEERRALKQERLNRLYLERVYYTGELRRDSQAVFFSLVGAFVMGAGFSISEETLAKIICGGGGVLSVVSSVVFTISGVKNYKKQNAKEEEHKTLEAQDPEDIDLEESYQPILK